MAQDIQSDIIDVIDDSDTKNHKIKQIKTVKQKIIEYDNDGNPTSSYLTNDIIIGANAYIYTNNGIALSSASSAEPSLFSVSIGDQTTATSDGGIAIGNHTTSNSANSIAIGSHVVTNPNQSQIVLGKFNVDDANSVFIIGDGDDSNNCHNVFTVMQDGMVKLSSKDNMVNISGNHGVNIIGSDYVSIDSTGSASDGGTINIGGLTQYSTVNIGKTISSQINIGSLSTTIEKDTVNIYGNTNIGSLEDNNLINVSSNNRGSMINIGNSSSESSFNLSTNGSQQTVNIGTNNYGNNSVIIGTPNTNGGTSTINIGLPLANFTSSASSQIELRGRTHAEQLNVDSLIIDNFTADTVRWGDGYSRTPDTRIELDKSIKLVSFQVPYDTQELTIALGDKRQTAIGTAVVYNLSFTDSDDDIINISNVLPLVKENVGIDVGENKIGIGVFSNSDSWFLLLKIRFTRTLRQNKGYEARLEDITVPPGSAFSSEFSYSYVEFSKQNQVRYSMVDALRDISVRLLALEP